MKVLWVFVLFLCLGSLLIISNHNLALYKIENLSEFGKIFLVWADQVYSNLQTITGNVVELNWTPA